MWPFRKKPTLQEQLVNAKALLAALEQTPDCDFTIYPSFGHPLIEHGIDRKPIVIARQKAKIAALEVHVNAQLGVTDLATTGASPTGSVSNPPKQQGSTPGKEE